MSHNQVGLVMHRTSGDLKDRIQVQTLIERIHELEVKRLVKGESEADSEEYLSAQRAMAEYVRKYPQLVKEMAKARSVRDQLNNFGRPINHDFPVLDYAEANDLGRVKRWLDMVDSDTPILALPYYTGCTIEVVYLGGVLHKAVTKGDGLHGRDLTTVAYSIQGIPQQIPELDRVSIRGVVTMDWSDPDVPLPMVISKLLMKADLTNERLMSVHRDLTFVPYDVHIPESVLNTSDLRSILHTWGFCDVAYKQFPANRKELGYLEEFFDDLHSSFDTVLPITGVLLVVDEAERRLDLGYTSKSPEWALLYQRDR